MQTILIRLLLLALGLSLCSIIGFMVGQYEGAIAGSILGSLLVYGLHARSGLKVIRWLDDFRVDNVPELSGWWDELAAKLFRYLRLTIRQQNALSNALDSFRKAAQALPEGVITLDAGGHITWCNATAQQHLSLKLSTDIGQLLTNLVRNPDFSQYMNSKQWDSPLTMRSPRNSSKVLSVQLVSYGDNQMLLMSRDVTQVEKLETMRRDFIANVSHELKTPLTVLTGFLETIRDLPLSAQQKDEYIELMHTQATRMRNLVEDLLTLSSLESAPQAASEPVSYTNLAQRAVEVARQVSGGKHQIECSVEEGLIGAGNTTELLSAFTNIVTNAVRYTPDQGKVSVSLFRCENDIGRPCAAFVVKDNGIGIAAEHIPRLTERFFRVDRSRSRESGGTGLGLAIVKHAVQRHDGELTIDSKVNQGSTFTILLPLKRVDKERLQAVNA